MHRAAIAEVGLQCLGNPIRVGTRRAVGIVHLHRHAAVVHEVGHCQALCVGFAARIGIAHVGPVDGRTHGNTFNVQGGPGGVGGGAVVGRNVGQRFGHRLVALVIHHLCHGRCHTSRNRCALPEVVGTLQVVGVALVPLRRHQLWHCRVNGHSVVNGNVGVGLNVFNLCGIVVEQSLHGIGGVVVVELAAVAVTQNVAGLVVARYNHESLLFATVENVVGFVGGYGVAPWCQFLVVHHRFQLACVFSFLQEGVSFLLRLLPGDGVGLNASRCHQTKQ